MLLGLIRWSNSSRGQLGVRLLSLLLIIGTVSTAPLRAEPIEKFEQLNLENDWPWWRGPTRDGHAVATTVPTQFSDTEHVRWKAPVPGRGHSSPIVVGERVLLTTANERDKTQSVLAFDRATGKPLWTRDVNQGGFPAKNHVKNTEASPTLACDGERLFATFYHHDQIELLALSLEGEILWRKSAGAFHPRKFEYGYGPSPLLYDDLVIVSLEQDGESHLIALSRSTGERKWVQPRPKTITFSSPTIAKLSLTGAKGPPAEQLVISGSDKVFAYDPHTGKALWNVDGTSSTTCGTIVWDGDTVYASGGYPKSQTIAVKADGSKKVLWKNDQKCYEQSMLAANGYLYGLTDNGVIFCWRGKDGREQWKHRLTGPVSASPVLAGGHIYWANELGTLYVFSTNPEKFALVAENQIGEESMASPAICGGQIFLRVASGHGTDRRETLYCFEEQ